MAVAPPLCRCGIMSTVQGHEGPCDVVLALGRGVLGSCGPFLDTGRLVHHSDPALGSNFSSRTTADEMSSTCPSAKVGVRGPAEALSVPLRHGVAGR